MPVLQLADMRPVFQDVGDVQAFLLDFETFCVDDSSLDLALAVGGVWDPGQPPVGLKDVLEDEVHGLGGEPGAAGVLVMLAQTVQVLDLLLEVYGLVKQNRLDQDLSQEHHLEVRVLREDLVDLWKVGLELPRIGETLLNQSLQMLDQ